MTREACWLRSYLRDVLTALWDVDEVEVDDDGDVPFRAGSAYGYVGVVDGDPLFVRVWAYAATDVKATAAVLREVNALNERAATAKVYLHHGHVVVEQTLHADAVEETTLGQAWQAVCVVANDIGPLFAAVHGGSTPFPVEDAPVDDREAG